MTPASIKYRGGLILFVTALGLAAFSVPSVSAQTVSATAQPTTSTTVKQSTKPVLSIPIPNLKFTDITIKESGKVQIIDIPWLADYILGIFNYALGISGAVAAIMMMIGGFEVLTSAGNTSRVTSGKQRISQAVFGMTMLFGTYLLLATVDTGLTSLRSVSVETTKQRLFEFEASAVAPADSGSGGGTATAPTDGSTIDKKRIVSAIMNAAKELNVDPCVALAICEHETGFRMLQSGKPGLPKTSAVAFGPCQVAINNLMTESNAAGLHKSLREKFPDYPPADTPKEEMKSKKIDFMLGNPEGAAYVSAYYMMRNGLSGSDQLTAAAGYAAGLGSIRAWRSANGCTATPLSFKEAAALGPETALQKSCIPHYVTVSVKGSSKCPEDKNNCGNVKIDNKGQFVGTCSNGESCFAMLTDDFVKYIIKNYTRLDSQYNCSLK